MQTSRLDIMRSYTPLFLLLLCAPLQLVACAHTAKSPTPITKATIVSVVTVNASLSKGHLRAKESDSYLLPAGSHSVELKLELQKNGQVEKTTNKRTPLHVAFVLDVSGSMSGSRLEQMKSAVRATIAQLREEDRVSIILFGSSATIVVDTAMVSQTELIERTLKKVEASGGTHLSNGLKKGIYVLTKHWKKPQIKHIVLVNDGKPNLGLTNKSDLNEMAFRAYVGGITISTFGLGLDVNKSILKDIAKYAGGRAYFHDSNLNATIADMSANLRALSNAHPPLQLKIRLPKNIEVMSVSNASHQQQDNIITLSAITMYQRTITLNLKVAPSKRAPLSKIDIIVEPDDRLKNKPTPKQNNTKTATLTVVHQP